MSDGGVTARAADGAGEGRTPLLGGNPGWAGERGEFDQLSEAQIRGDAYVGERPRAGADASGACSYPYLVPDGDPDAPLFAGPYEERFQKILTRYPDRRGALLPTLNLAQEVRGWLSPASMARVAELLDLSPAYVRGVATFYTMYNKRAVGRFLIQVCTNVACNLCGGDRVMEAFLDATGLEPGQTSEDGRYTVMEVECLGACGFPTAVQINSRYFENVEPEDVPAILEALEAGDSTVPGRGASASGPGVEEGS